MTIDTMNTIGRDVTESRFTPRFTLQLRRFWSWIEECLARRRSRLDLLQLTDDQLHDIGVSRRDARREGTRPFWE